MLNVWDAAAVQPIIEEAGGTFTDWQGNPTIHAGKAIATNGLVLEEVLAATSAVGRIKRYTAPNPAGLAMDGCAAVLAGSALCTA